MGRTGLVEGSGGADGGGGILEDNSYGDHIRHRRQQIQHIHINLSLRSCSFLG